MSIKIRNSRKTLKRIKKSKKSRKVKKSSKKNNNVKIQKSINLEDKSSDEYKYLQERIKINLSNCGKGFIKSKGQAIAISYNQTYKHFNNTKKK